MQVLMLNLARRFKLDRLEISSRMKKSSTKTFPAENSRVPDEYFKDRIHI